MEISAWKPGAFSQAIPAALARMFWKVKVGCMSFCNLATWTQMSWLTFRGALIKPYERKANSLKSLNKALFLGGGGIELGGVPLGSHDDGYFEGPTPAKKQVQTLPLEGPISLGWETTTGVWFGEQKRRCPFQSVVSCFSSGRRLS